MLANFILAITVGPRPMSEIRKLFINGIAIEMMLLRKRSPNEVKKVI